MTTVFLEKVENVRSLQIQRHTTRNLYKNFTISSRDLYGMTGHWEGTVDNKIIL